MKSFFDQCLFDGDWTRQQFKPEEKSLFFSESLFCSLDSRSVCASVSVATVNCLKQHRSNITQESLWQLFDLSLRQGDDRENKIHDLWAKAKFVLKIFINFAFHVHTASRPARRHCEMKNKWKIIGGITHKLHDYRYHFWLLFAHFREEPAGIWSNQTD